jgi:hypothetical protein
MTLQPPHLNFLICEENFVFFFLSAPRTKTEFWSFGLHHSFKNFATVYFNVLFVYTAYKNKGVEKSVNKGRRSAEIAEKNDKTVTNG